MRLIDADSIIEYPSLDTVSIKEEFTNAIFRNLSENVIIENEDELMNLCKDIMELFMNVVKTAPTVENIAHWKELTSYLTMQTRTYRCTNCREMIKVRYGVNATEEYPECPRCKAIMIEQPKKEEER